MSLPTPRDLLTSLIKTLSAPSPQNPSSNPLRDAPPEKAALLSTLHVLFPSLLLPALDLLDRGLVTRVLRAEPAQKQEAQRGPGEGAEEGHGGVDPGDEAAAADTGLYVVRSLASTMKRRDGTYHVVLLHAWSCTCPSFTLDAFPPGPLTHHGEAGTAAERSGGAEGWSFGGVSVDGLGVPCCKHLLACVLAERWAALGGYVSVKRVRRGEMAGLVADV